MTNDEVNQLKNQAYLGDGFFVGDDGYQLWLYASNGIDVLDAVALEPHALQAFIKYLVKYQFIDSEEGSE